MTVLEQEYYETMIRSMTRISEALEKILTCIDACSERGNKDDECLAK